MSIDREQIGDRYLDDGYALTQDSEAAYVDANALDQQIISPDMEAELARPSDTPVAPDVPEVTERTPADIAELIPRGFVLADASNLELGALRGGARMALAELEREVAPPRNYIREYRTCEIAHAGVDQDMQAATEHLFHAMGPLSRTEKSSYAGRVDKESWHKGIHELPSGRTFEVAYKVGVTIDERVFGAADTTHDLSFIMVTAYPIHRASHVIPAEGSSLAFEYEMAGSVIFGTDSSTRTIEKSEVSLTDFKDLERQAYDALSKKAYGEVAKSQIESLSALPETSMSTLEMGSLLCYEIATRRDGASYFRDSRQESFARLLTGAFKDETEAIESMTNAFNPLGCAELKKIMEWRLPSLAIIAQSHEGLHDRLCWVLEKAATVPQAMETAAYQAISFGFADEMTERLAKERAKVEAVESLARELTGMDCINNCWPVNPEKK